MKVAVMGAGAVGCWYGGRLAAAGHEVVLIGRPALVEAIHQNGLRLVKGEEVETLALKATTDPGAVRGAELVLCCVKATDIADAGQAMAPYLALCTQVLSLQNGVDSAERLGAALGRPAVPVAVYVALRMAGPGTVEHLGRGELLVPACKTLAPVAALFEAAGVGVTRSDNVEGALWAKLIVNCAWNALSGLTRGTYGTLMQVPGVEALLAAVVAECLAVARALEVTIPGDRLAAVRAIATDMAGQRSSTAQDLARGRPSEIEHLNGYLVRKAEACGVAVPVNRTLLTLVRALETPNA